MNKLKKLLAVLVCMAMTMAVVPGLTVSAAEIPEGLKYDVFDDYVEITDYTGSATSLNIPTEIEGKPVTEIGRTAFSYCKSLTNISIPESVISIGDFAFEYCDSLSDVNISDNVKRIGSGAFEKCSNLKNVSIGKNVEDFGVDVFAETPVYNDKSNWKGNALYICDYLIEVNPDASGTFSVAPGTHAIAGGAFASCGITDVNIPDGVIGIGEWAFTYCEKLTHLELPDSVEFIGEEVIDATPIETIILPKNLKEIGEHTFWSHSKLKKITISSGVQSIGYEAFAFCECLSEVIFEEGNLKSIGMNAFLDCDLITELDLPKSLEVIGQRAFSSCKNLRSFTVGNNLKTIERWAFEDCTSLKDVYYMGTKEEWQLIDINEMNEELTSANIHYNSVMPKPEPAPEIGDPEITVSDGTLSITMAAENVPASAELIAISYGTDGGLVDIAPVENGAASLDAEGVKTVKVFCWESLESMKPLCEAKEVTV